MTRLTDDAIAAIRARADAATPGPWRDRPGWDDATDTENNNRIVTSDYTDDNRDQRAVVVGDLWYDGPHVLVAPVDATFIAAARTDVPALLADRAALVTDLEAMTKERDDWRQVGDDMQGLCKRWSERAALAEQRLESAKATEAERDTLAAKLAEVERERDEAVAARHTIPEHLTLNMAKVRSTIDGLIAERDAARAEQRRLAAEVEDLRQHLASVIDVVDELTVNEPTNRNNVEEARAAYRAAPQPPAVDETTLASAIRALPDEEPPSGYVERAEVRRCEVAVVEAVLAEDAAADRYADAHNQFTGLKFGSSARAESEFRLTELLVAKIAAGDSLRSAIRDLRAAREKAGGK